MNSFTCRTISAIGLCLLASRLPAPVLLAQGRPPVAASCELPSPVFQTGAPNIFNDQQEQYLGDALAELEEAELQILPPTADDELTRIGERLLATLPPTGIHYRFRMYDSGEVNGLSLAGGRVYISRKLITALKNEDELAGVVAHELGHLTTHQTAIEFTRALSVRLGVTQVTDRADIYARVHQYFSTPYKSGEEVASEQKNQLVADRVALYAMVRAGYAPQAFVSFFDEISINKGKKGNWLSDFAGMTGEEAKRYRTGLEQIATLPAGCQQKPPVASTDFLAWQRSVVEERTKAVAEGATGDKPMALDPPIHPSPWRISFSPDSHYILVQDDESIGVVDHTTARFLFRIDAPNAKAAYFSPDSHELVFDDNTLRVERWDVASGKRTSVKELLIFDGCQQTLLAPDGKTLVCLNLNQAYDLPRVSLRLIDVETGKPFYDKPDFYTPTIYAWAGGLYGVLALVDDARRGRGVAYTIISPDGRYLIVAVMKKLLVYDLEHRQPITVGGKLRELDQQRMTFVGSNQLYVVGDLNSKGLHDASLYSFPDGRLIKQGVIGDQLVGPVAHGPYIIAMPLKSYAAGVWDPEAGKFAGASVFSAIDVYDNLSASEDPTGALQYGELGGSKYTLVQLPLGPLPGLEAATFSPDGKFLAVSMRNRAMIWDLETGKQKGTIRPFRSAWIDGGNQLHGQFPKYMEKEPAEMAIDLAQMGGKSLGKFEPADWQYGNIVYTFKPMGKDKSTNRDATLVVRPMGSTTVSWQRDYVHETPVCWSAEGNRLLLAWDLSTEGAKAELKGFPNLQPEIDALKGRKKGILIEIVNPSTGAALQQVVLPEADLTGGSQDSRRAMVSGDYVLARGEHDNTVIYRLKDASKVGEFFGNVLTGDSESGLIVAYHRDDEILLVEQATGKELERFTLGSSIRLAHLVRGADGKPGTLLVLTADQVVHRLPIVAAAQVASK